MKNFLNIGVLSLTVLAMLSVGLELEVGRFKQLAKDVRPLAIALLLQVVLVPAIGLLVSYGLDLSPTLRSGVLLVAACPVGDIANFFTLLARGNLAISVSYNTISCLIAPLSMTIVFAGYSRILGTPFAFGPPSWQLVLPFILLIAVPILVGAGLRFVQSPVISQISRFLRFICLAGVIALCAYVVVSRSYQFRTEWKSAAGASALLAFVTMIMGWMVSRALRMEQSASIALLISFAVRNVGLATAIAIAIMNRIEYAVISTVYFLSEVVLVLCAIIAFRLWGTQGHI